MGNGIVSLVNFTWVFQEFHVLKVPSEVPNIFFLVQGLFVWRDKGVSNVFPEDFRDISIERIRVLSAGLGFSKIFMS